MQRSRYINLKMTKQNFKGFYAIWIISLSSIFFIENCFGSTPGSPMGYFEVQIIRVQNTGGELFTGNCCDGKRRNYGCTADQCDTFFRVCLKEYQSRTTEPDTDSCTFGNTLSPVLGQNSFRIDNPDDPTNPGRIRIPLLFTWTRTFTMILETLDAESLTDPQVLNYEEQLIDKHTFSNMLNPTTKWQKYSHNGRSALIEYKLRVRCGTNYYGYNCTKFCNPRNDYHGRYTCDKNGNKQCLPGWMGKDCTEPQCRLGCHSDHGSCDKPDECKCEYGWQGELCTECIPYPGCDHGYCNSPWQCICETNWGGLLCNKNLNYCGTHHPCENGGTCTNPRPDEFQCMCVDGYSGIHCEISEYSCLSDPCQNGGVCQQDLSTSFRCDCQEGWTGITCQENVNDCASQPCERGGTCHDLVRGFRCECPSPWEGATCNLDADECKESPCKNAKSCRNMPGYYHCDCLPGWEGVNCDLNVNECLSNECKNGATCVDLTNGFHCSCAPGYTGQRCETNINECESSPCLRGGNCIDRVNDYTCICPSGYSGENCQLNIDHCTPNPCQNGAECFNEDDHYYCECPSNGKYRGKNCSILRDVCKTTPCEVIDSCTIHVHSNTSASGYEVQPSQICGDHGHCESLMDNKYNCACDLGYEGDHCQFNVNDCVDVNCLNGGTCIDGLNSHLCMCVDGWVGEFCEQSIDQCSPDPCHGRGTCVPFSDDFICQCNEPWKGKTCGNQNHYCDENTCANGGECIDREDSYFCNCSSGWTGISCTKRTVSVCASFPCKNDGVCVGTGDSYECYCKEGFAGLQCEENINDCTPHPCYNKGKCMDGINHHTCQCLPGFAGPDCRININECLSNPCAADSVCEDLINDYRCKCPEKRTGKNCENVERPNNSCLRNRNFYPDGSTWTEVCNTCTCKKGVTECTKMWCGEESCAGFRVPDPFPCPSPQSCQLLMMSDCFTPQCLVRGVCRDMSDPQHPLKLPEPASKCIPNSASLPTSNCVRVNMRFDLNVLPLGVWVQDICLAIRLLPSLAHHAKIYPLVVRCGVDKEKKDIVRVTLTSNTTFDSEEPIAAAKELLSLSFQEKNQNDYFSALINVNFDSADQNAESNYMITLLAALGAALFALLSLTFLICYCVVQRRKRRQKERSNVNLHENNKNLIVNATESVKSWKKCEADPPPKIPNKDLQEQKQVNVVSEQLAAGKGAYGKLDANELTATLVVPEKLTVAVEEMKRLDPNSLSEEAQVHPVSKQLSTSTTSSQPHHRADQIELVGNTRSSDKMMLPHRCNRHPGSLLTSSGHYSRRPHGFSTRRMQASVQEHPEDVEEVLETSCSSSHQYDRLPCCHVDPCRCESRAPYSSYSVYAPGMQEELSESEEVAMLTSSRSISPRCSHAHYRRCNCHRPRSQQHFDDTRRLRRHSSSFQDGDAYNADVNSREPLLASPSRVLQRSSAEVPILPPYESVVRSDDSYSHSTTPSCDCGRHLPPTSYIQSPPPSYSHHCNRTLQSWRSNEPRSGGCERAPSCSGGQTSSRYENTRFCYAGHNAAATNGDSLSRASVSSPGVEPTTLELTNGSKSPTRDAIA